jgi:hypothetical protein
MKIKHHKYAAFLFITCVIMKDICKYKPKIILLLPLNSSGRTMALGLTQSLTEMSTRNIFWG